MQKKATINQKGIQGNLTDNLVMLVEFKTTVSWLESKGIDPYTVLIVLHYEPLNGSTFL
jgi:hypothetical protein